MEQHFMKTAFFDFDGVVVDTEPIYEEFPISHPISKERHYLIYWISIFPTGLKNLKKW